MPQLLKILQAIAETTRLRILGLCAHSDLAVSELVQILDQSQPRVSRHLKLLMEAGVLERSQEGNWAYYRVTERGTGAALARQLIDLMEDSTDHIQQDLKRLADIKEARAAKAMEYFSRNAQRWDQLRSLHAEPEEIEKNLLKGLQDQKVDSFLDLGTGTGRLLELMIPHTNEAVGLDCSREMLAVAQRNLERRFEKGDGSSAERHYAGRHYALRHGSIEELPFGNDRFDAITLHMVLHYLQDPKAAFREAGRVLKPNGRLVVIDFAPHSMEVLRDEHAHHWMGFNDDQIQQFGRSACLRCERVVSLPGDRLPGDRLPGDRLPGDRLNVRLWWLLKDCERQ